jgi:predicted transcriptional regulator
MEVLWRMRRGSVQAVLDEINKERAEPLAYTTVLTVMSQLWERGMLSRRKNGRSYIYRPTSDKRGYKVERIRNFFVSLFGTEEKVVASHLLDALEDEDPSRIDELVRELKERKYI